MSLLTRQSPDFNVSEGIYCFNESRSWLYNTDVSLIACNNEVAFVGPESADFHKVKVSTRWRPFYRPNDASTSD